jgi:hypothetical protein
MSRRQSFSQKQRDRGREAVVHAKKKLTNETAALQIGGQEPFSKGAVDPGVCLWVEGGLERISKAVFGEGDEKQGQAEGPSCRVTCLRRTSKFPKGKFDSVWRIFTSF